MCRTYQGYMNGEWALRRIHTGRSQADMTTSRDTRAKTVKEQEEARKRRIAILLAALTPLNTGVPSIRALERNGNLIAPRLIATPAPPDADFLMQAHGEKELSREEREEAHMNRLCGPYKNE